jgi:transcriptional regulator with XRE-family HTH domain
MIRTEAEYRKMSEKLQENQAFRDAQYMHLRNLGLSEEQIERVMQPTESFNAQFLEDIQEYEQLKSGKLPSLHNLNEIGRWLIGTRISRKWSQKELAQSLGVSEAQVSRDERNEYHGITIERANHILDVLGVQYRLELDAPSHLRHIDSIPAFEPPSSDQMFINHPIQVYLRVDPKLGPDESRRLYEFLVEKVNELVLKK